MSLHTETQELAARAGQECRALRMLINGNAVDLSGLSTTAKGSLVAAINELFATGGGGGGTTLTNYSQISGLTGYPTSFTPSAHKSTHATAGSDAISPSDIGAMPATGGTMTNATISGTVAFGPLAAAAMFTAMGGVGTITAPTITPTVSGYTETVTAIGTLGATVTLSIAASTFLTATMGNMTTAFTLPNASGLAGKSFVLVLTGAGASDVATWSTVKWLGGTAPTLNKTAGKKDVLSFMCDGTDWIGQASTNA